MSNDNKSPQLHELLPAEQDLAGQANKILHETASVFKKSALFSGSETEFEPFDAKDSHLIEGEAQHENLGTTVQERLEYTAGKLSRYYDAVLQKEATNQEAQASIIVDGDTIATNVPATMLLGLEDKLTKFRDVLSHVPTLDAKVKWEPADDVRAGAFRASHPIKRFKTDKVVKPVVLYEHVVEDGVAIPAQVEQVTEDVKVGLLTTHKFSGAISSARAAVLMEKTDKLIRAVKSARQRANKQAVVNRDIGNDLFSYILK